MIPEIGKGCKNIRLSMSGRWNLSCRGVCTNKFTCVDLESSLLSESSSQFYVYKSLESMGLGLNFTR